MRSSPRRGNGHSQCLSMASVSENHLSPCLCWLRCLPCAQEGSLATAEEDSGHQPAQQLPQLQLLLRSHDPPAQPGTCSDGRATKAASGLADLQRGWHRGRGVSAANRTEENKVFAQEVFAR